MRDYMNLLEGIIENVDIEMNPDDAHHTAGMGKTMQGTFLNPDMMLQYFPSVQDKHAFNRAWRKIVRNQEERMTRLEMFEISRAFVDILRMPDDQKLSFMRRIINVSAAPGTEDETASTIYR